MNELAQQLAAAVCSAGPGPLFVHSDLLKVRSFVPRIKGRQELLAAHLQLLNEIAGERHVWTPCFNYEYPKTRFVDLRSAPSQVGPLGDFRREQPDVWRTIDPIFSVCGTGPVECDPKAGGHLEAFSESSVFAELCRRDGTLVFYGAPFSSATILHLAETRSGGPLYRYDKTFPGKVVTTSGEEMQFDYVYHVRPWERHLDYGWDRLIADATAQGVLHPIQRDEKVLAFVASANELVDYWVGEIAKDPFYLLDDEAREWVVPFHERVGRRFEISDFE